MISLPKPFPSGIDVDENLNPAIRLYGRRFFIDQTILEIMSEFLGILFSPKWIYENKEITMPLPSMDDLRTWPDSVKLKYSLPIKLNLKLFALLGASRVDTRHDIHGKQYEDLCNTLKNRIHTNEDNHELIAEWIEGLLQGFQGVGFNRGWCAQTFFPVSKSLLTRETIWNVSVAKRKPIRSWKASINNFKTYYSIAGHNFMARSGEVIYLQLCNALSQEQNNISRFAKYIDLTKNEIDLTILHESLQEGLIELGGEYTGSLDKLIDFIEMLDNVTHEITNKDNLKQTCEWCTRESWKEGYLFAVEINRLLKATLDPVERLDMLMTGCTLQVMRSICAQSMRYQQNDTLEAGGLLKYAWIFTSQDSSSKQLKLVSQRNLQVVQGVIQRALHNNSLKENTKKAGDKKAESLYREADNKYGHKLFLTLGKRLNIISPKKGPGARFVMTDKLLRYLVISLVEPGKRCTIKTFLLRLYQHYGIAIEGKQLQDAIRWSSLSANNSHLLDTSSWLSEMLQAGGFFTKLSDACSIVHNDFK